jgi:hypothetical protein
MDEFAVDARTTGRMFRQFADLVRGVVTNDDDDRRDAQTFGRHSPRARYLTPDRKKVASGHIVSSIPPDLPPDAPSFVTSACMLGYAHLHSGKKPVGRPVAEGYYFRKKPATSWLHARAVPLGCR